MAFSCPNFQRRFWIIQPQKSRLDREAHKEDFESHSVNAYNTNLNLNGGDLRTGTAVIR